MRVVWKVQVVMDVCVLEQCGKLLLKRWVWGEIRIKKKGKTERERRGRAAFLNAAVLGIRYPDK